MINPEQIRAARALLDWSTAELAKEAGLTVNGINKIERGHVQAHSDTITKIESVFEAAGIEFLPGSGLRKKDRIVVVHEGEDAYLQLWDDVYLTLKQGGGEVLIANVDEGRSMDIVSRKRLEAHLERLKQFNITERLLVRQGETNFVAPLEYYHAIPEQYFSAYPFFIYGSKLALLSRHPALKVIIIDDKRFSESVGRLFNFVWDRTQSPAVATRKHVG